MIALPCVGSSSGLFGQPQVWGQVSIKASCDWNCSAISRTSEVSTCDSELPLHEAMGFPKVERFDRPKSRTPRTELVFDVCWL